MSARERSGALPPFEVSLWECENCGARAVDGRGAGWTAGGSERLHDCKNTKPGLLGRASRVDLSPAERALLGMVRGYHLWADDEDGVHYASWPFYVEACRVLGLPPPREEEPDPAPAPAATRASALADGIAAILTEDPGVVLNVADYGMLTTGDGGKRYSNELAATLRGLGWRFDAESAQWVVSL